MEELVQRLTALKIVEERLEWHPGADEDRRAPRISGSLWTIRSRSIMERSVAHFRVYTGISSGA